MGSRMSPASARGPKHKHHTVLGKEAAAADKCHQQGSSQDNCFY